MIEKRLKTASLVVAIFVGLASMVNMTVTSYVLLNDRQTASMSPNQRESLNTVVEVDLGRPSPLTQMLRSLRSWVGTWYVGSAEAENATTGITISVTGSNVASQATLCYYIEGKASDNSGNKYRFLQGNGSSISVGGASLEVTNQTSIEKHLQSMGLNTSESHTVDYYLYVYAEATGAVSGETLTSEISKTLFDTVTYTYGTEVTESITASTTWTFPDGNAWQDLNELRVAKPNGQDYSSAMVFPISTYQSYDIIDAWFRLWVEEGASDGNLADTGPLIFSRCTETPGSSHDFYNPPAHTENYQFTAWLSGDNTNREWLVEHENVLEQFTEETGDELAILIEMSLSSDYSVWTATGKGSSTSSKHPMLKLKYISYSTSWYEIPPLSVVDMPVTIELGALLVALAVTVGVLYDIKMRRNV